MKNYLRIATWLTCFALPLIATKTHAQTSDIVLEEWPFTTNNQDSSAVRATGIVGTVPTLTHLYLSTTSTPQYSATNGETLSAGSTTPGDGHWSTAQGGPGGTLSRVMYQQFQIIPASGYSLRVDSILTSNAFISSSSGTTMMYVYSLSNFVSDSANISGYTFASSGDITLAQVNAAPLPQFNLALNGATGVTVPAGDTLTIRQYFTCSSSSAGRYAETMDFIVKGITNSTTSCLSQPGSFTNITASVCAGQNSVLYSVPHDNAATSYTWSYSGTGATFSSTTDSVMISFASNATSGTLSVNSNAACGSSPVRTAAITVNALPANTITTAGAATICPGASITLNGSTGTGNTYQWFLGSTAIPSATNATYSASAIGSYKVAITANGCSDTSAAFAVTAGSVPPATITTPGSATSFCSNSSLILTANSGTGYTYQWRLNGANISHTAINDTVTAAGAYSVIVSSGGGCNDTSAATNITVATAPANTVTAGGSTTICSGGSVTLNVATSTGSTYQWLKNGAVITGATSSSYSATATGAYTVAVTGSNTCKDTSAATSVALVIPNDTVTVIGPTTFCAGSDAVLNVPATTGSTYQWLNNGTAISGATANNYNATTAGSYKIAVANSGCKDTSSAITITVLPLPGDTISAAGATTFCAGGSVTLNVTNTSGATYQWLNNGTAISGATSASYSANATGTYKVKVTGSNTCFDTSAATTVTVNPLPVPVIAEVNHVLTVTGGTFTTYQWTFNGNNVATSSTLSIDANGNGVYKVTVTNSNGCTGTSAADTVRDEGVQNISQLQNAITVYPNPATSTVNINAPVAVNISILSVDGRQLIYAEKAKEVNISNLANGMYLIMVYDENNTLIKTDKLLKN